MRMIGLECCFPVFLRLVRKLLCLAVICLGLAGPFLVQAYPAAHAAAPDAPKKILFIPSYNFNYLGIQWFNKGFMLEMEGKNARNISYSMENLQLATHSGDEAYFKAMAESLQIKYTKEKPDLIVAQYRQSYDFLHDYGRQIFGDVPVVFAGLELEGYSDTDIPAHFNGVVTSFNAKRGIDLILQMQPQVRTLYVINGVGTAERAMLARTLTEARQYQERLQLVVLSDLPFAQMLARVAEIRGDAAILYLSMQLDAAGRILVPAAVAGDIAGAAQVPVYGMLDTYVGSGVTGGFLINHEKLGRRAADIALSILQGQAPTRSFTTESIGEYSFDWRQLKRWGIDEGSLPAGSRVEFKEFSVWESYKMQIVSGILLILLLGSLVIALLINRRRRKQVEEALREVNENLEEKVAVRTRELDIANESLTVQNEETIAMNEELTAQNEEITSMNKEIESLNQNLTALNAELEQRVAERTSDLAGANQELAVQYDELRQSQTALQRRAEIQEVLKNIAETALLAFSVDELYEAVHGLIGRVLPVEHFHINFLDEAAEELVVQYSAGEMKGIPKKRALNKGVMEYAMRHGKALHIDPKEFDRLIENGEIALKALPINDWLVAPLIDSKGRVFGTIALNSLDILQTFQPEDVEALSIIAAQVSLAIERKQAEEQLLESESRYRTVLENAPDSIIICDPDTGKVIEANAAFTKSFGYDLKQGELFLIDDLIVDTHENIQANLTRVKKDRFLPVQRRVLRHRNGTVVEVERSATMIRFLNRDLLVQTLRDVTEKVRREQELQRDAQLATRVQGALLSKPEPSDYLEIATIYRPIGYVGGDLYFLDWRYDGNLLRGFLVDAPGHGLGTALHTASLHVLLREVNERDLPLADAIRWLNRRAVEYFDEGTFAGALAFELDLQTRQLRWTCAGIPKTWVSTKTHQGTVECPGMCLGINEEETFETHTMAIDVDDSFYFMTDGLSDLIRDQLQLPLENFSDTVELLKILSEAENCRDDATAVCVHVRALPRSLVREDGWPRIIRFNGYGDYQRLKGEVAKILTEVTGLPHSLHEVAVHEALANALECRDGVPRHHKAHLRFNKVGNRLIVRVKTSRMGFAGNSILKRLSSHPEDMFSFGEDASMGRGIPMMLSMSHKMTYNGEGTEVLLAWKL